ncbi:hypothetical protein N9H60_02905 [Flavimaricola sp.]|jgi:ABC-type amino acid transport system permease subunit|nr:hypothetical protein [Flavimaricola sp.]MDA9020108.1 hypothetical protein [Flavimaricola sp.]
MTLFDLLTLDFLLDFLQGLTLNLSTALIVLTAVLPIAYLLAMGMNSRHALVSRPIAAFIKLLQALPVFVVLFFMSGVLTEKSPLLVPFRGNLPLMLLVFGQTPYVLAYGSDQFSAMFGRLERGDRRQALLIIPSIGRAFQMVVSTSCFGAALGVPEAMSVVIFAAEQLPDEATQIIFYAIASLMFLVILRICLIPFRVLHVVFDKRIVASGQTAA